MMIEIDSVDVDVENLYLSRIKNYIKHSFVLYIQCILYKHPMAGNHPSPQFHHHHISPIESNPVIKSSEKSSKQPNLRGGRMDARLDTSRWKLGSKVRISGL